MLDFLIQNASLPDESDDPLSRHVETLAYETQRLGLHGRVTG